MWCSERRRILLLLGGALPLLAGCGFSPLYGDAHAARGVPGTVQVPTLPGRFGFDMRERLVARLGPAERPLYRLDVTWTVEEEKRAIRADRTITRYNLTATAKYALVPLAGGDPVTDGRAQAFTAYSTVASPFATRAAEQDAHKRLAQELAESIALRLTATADRWAP